MGRRLLGAVLIAATWGLMAAPTDALPGDAEAIAKASILDNNPDDVAAVTKVCTACHGAALFLNAPRSSQRWEETYAEMAKNGARGSIDELNGVVYYMEKNFTIVDVNRSPPDELGPTLQVGGDVLAKILARREQKPFKDVADLASIRGVDPTILEKLNSRHLLLF